MSDDNSDSAPSNDTGGGVGRTEEEEEARRGASSPGLSGGSSSDTNCERGTAPGGVSKTRGSTRAPQGASLDDMDAHSSGNDSGERESEGRMGREASRGRQSTCSSQFSSSHNGKDSAMLLETTESNKSSNSQSPSPPSSSVAYSLLSASSEQDHPSTSGCSSEQSARLQTQKELLQALKELKIRVPTERKGKGGSSTLDALKYALKCVKQVRANQEYYHQWSVEETHGCSLDLSTFTIEELDNITSEYTLKNTDTFSVAISFISGRVVYISPQASCLLRCKPERLQGALFSELLAPQDVSTFYSNTAPCRLPLWSACTGAAASPVDCTQEKPMFCRIGGGREYEGGVRYYPFRLTPYQLTLRDSDVSDPQPCCLLIAERVHSGYEAPRIPADKRIFTTSHTPNCLFQELDERAVPLLGYLPQDLVGTPVLLYLHPDDRPIMVAIHKKILQFAGQPFEHSPLRMCARSGEYLTIDTSWSSFVNPWSRKVAFIVGRHKVRTSPLNEDVFTPPRGVEGRVMVPEIHQLSEQIHRLLVQPVHSGSSQGYCSLGSNGSHEPHPSAASSSDSTGATADEPAPLHKPMTFQQICKDVHMVKTNGQQVFIDSRNRPPPRKQSSTAVQKTVQCSEAMNLARGGLKEDAAPLKAVTPPHPVRKEAAPAYSYQQINCLDSIIRYLESCNVPNTVKRKCGSSSCTTSSTSDDDKQKEVPGTPKAVTLGAEAEPKGSPQGPAHPLTPLALHSKAESVASVTSQCSFSSTIVHVGDKKPPESDIVMEETTPTATPAPLTPPPTVVALPAPAPPSPAAPERDGRRAGVGRVGLTKEVLLAHTQQEEQAFLGRFQDLSQLRVFDPSSALHAHAAQRRHTATPFAKGVRSSRDYPAAGSSGRRRGRGGKRLKHQEGSIQGLPMRRGGTLSGSAVGLEASAERRAAPPFPAAHHLPLGPQTSSSSWPPSVGSQASLPSVPYHPGVLPLYPLYPPLAPHLAHTGPDTGFSPNQQSPPRYPLQTPQLPPPLVPPMMAFVLPNYMFPQPHPAMTQLNPAMTQLNPAMTQLNPAMTQLNPAMTQLNPAMTQLNPVMTQLNPAMTQLNPAISQQFYNPNPAFPFLSPAPVPTNPLLPSTATPTQRPPSRSSTPHSGSPPPPEREGVDSPLFQSRCSSPLNLLQLEESPSNRLEVPSALTAPQQTPPPVGEVSPDWTGKQGGGAGGQPSATRNSTAADSKENENAEANESSNQDAMSTSSDLLDLLLQEDSQSGTGSAASGSGSSGSRSGSSGTGSNGCSTSGSGTRSSSNTSKYFGSIDSSENDHTRKQPAGGAGEEQFMKYVLQDPIWLLMANTDEKVMMTYQLPVRDQEEVLRGDRAALRAMQKHQPRFTEPQKRELSKVHPWIRTGRLPQAIDITACVECGSPPSVPETAPFDVELHDMELSAVLQPPEEGVQQKTPDSSTALAPPETAMEEEEKEEEDQREGAAAGTTHSNDQEMTTEEQEVTSQTVEEKGTGLSVMAH
ncbi:period circadian protein homolog 1-like [Megalops cyprinoides]|uniref:period circadian protein homolog 1-like n=1 Tax=Megalops cyprinoides TaxID=118141 RepID=UPI001865195D|nr:period circadian protein homolog 1-like [Megalops cyprinoides]